MRKCRVGAGYHDTEPGAGEQRIAEAFVYQVTGHPVSPVGVEAGNKENNYAFEYVGIRRTLSAQPSHTMGAASA